MSADAPYTAEDQQRVDDHLQTPNSLHMQRYFFETPSRITDYMQDNCTMATIGGAGKAGSREKLDYGIYLQGLQSAHWLLSLDTCDMADWDHALGPCMIYWRTEPISCEHALC